MTNVRSIIASNYTHGEIEAMIAEPGKLVVIEDWSGGHRPFRGVVYCDGQHIGTTGGCGSRSTAEFHGRRIAASW